MVWKRLATSLVIVLGFGLLLYQMNYIVEVQEDTQMCFDKVAKAQAAILHQMSILDKRRVYPGLPTQLTSTVHKPAAIMGIDFGEKVDGMRPGDHYVLKVFSIDGGEVAFGFSKIETEGPQI